MFLGSLVWASLVILSVFGMPKLFLREISSSRPRRYLNHRSLIKFRRVWGIIKIIIVALSCSVVSPFLGIVFFVFQVGRDELLSAPSPTVTQVDDSSNHAQPTTLANVQRLASSIQTMIFSLAQTILAMIKENLTDANVGDAPADMYLDVEGLITIEVDLPGTSLSAVNLQLVDHNLELSFTKTTSPANVQYIHRERNRTCKPRVIRDLPIGITVDDIKATMFDGVLKITLPGPRKLHERKQPFRNAITITEN